MFWCVSGSNRIDMQKCFVSDLFLMSDIARRARKLLVARDNEELDGAACNVDAMIDGFFEESESRDREGGFPADDTFRRGVVTDTWVLRTVIDSYDLDSDPYFPNGWPFEYFAVLALCHVIDGTHVLKPPRGSPAPDPKLVALGLRPVSLGEEMKAALREMRWVRAGRDAVEAMEALSWAEGLTERRPATGTHASKLEGALAGIEAQVDELAESKVKRKISENASRAAHKRHARDRELKAQARLFFVAHRQEYPSLDALATALASEMPYVVWRTIRDWFTEFNRPDPSHNRRR